MSIDTWVKRVLSDYRQNKINDIDSAIDYGHKVYNQLPSLRLSMAENYTELLQHKHNDVYNTIIGNYR